MSTGLVTVALAAAMALLSLRSRAQDAALLERGRYLVETAAFCGVCHATRGSDGRPVVGMELAGGRVLAERGFRAVAPNITPDEETGIGRWSDAEIAAAIRNGQRPDGSLIGPPMPVELYRGISDRYLRAMVAYLRSTPPVRHAVLEHSTYPEPLVTYGPPVASVPDPPQADPVARGAYLAGPVAHCMDCHTPALPGEHRDWSRMGAGGIPFEGPWGVVASRNITPSKEHGIGRWTDQQIVDAITKGIAADGRRLVPPMGGRAPIWAKLSQDDLHDLVVYLRSLPEQD
ncbi:MAG: cytochrome c [Pseudomonadota bacterium]|nr:cytochrome c [Pseudomonadota bacterium]